MIGLAVLTVLFAALVAVVLARTLRDSESRLSGIVATAMDAIIGIDAQQRIVVFNRAAERQDPHLSQPAPGFILPEPCKSTGHGPAQRQLQSATGDNSMDFGPKLNPAIQGLDVFVEVEGKPVRAIIPRVVFEGPLHCHVGPSEWPRAYQDHAAAIDAIVRRRFATKAQDFVVLRSSDFGAGP